MFCRKCGNRLPDDSVFCPACGQSVNEAPKPVSEVAPTIYEPRTAPEQTENGNIVFESPKAAPVLAETPYIRPESYEPAPAAAAPAAAVKVKKRSPIKAIVLILAALVLVAAIVFVLMRFVFRRPGDAIVTAFGKTLSADSFKVEATIEYDYEELFDFLTDVMDEDLEYKSEDEMKQHIEDEYGYIVDEWKTTAYGAVSGKEQDFVVYAQIAEMYQFRFDEDYIELKLGNAYLEGRGIETQEEKEKTKGDIKDIFDMVSSRDIANGVKDNKEINSDLKKYFAKNYDQAPLVLAELLNDTDAKYIKDYEKSGSSYSYTIDIFKFLRAVEKNKTLKCTDEFSEMLDDMEEELDEEGIQDLQCKLTVSTSWGRLDTIEVTPIIEDYQPVTTTVRFYDYNKVKSDDLEMQDFDGDFDPILTPSIIEYKEKSDLREANSMAKAVYTEINNTLSWYYYNQSYKYKRFGKKLSEYDRYDNVQDSAVEAMLWYIDEDEMNDYYVFFSTNNGQSAKLVQVKGPNGIVGQYPNPASTIDEAKAIKMSPED